MTEIHPSLTLVFDLDEHVATQEVKLEIARCYSYVTTPLVRTHSTPHSDEETLETPHNIARYIVSMGQKKYLMSSDEGADKLWDNSVEPWLSSMFFKVGNAAAAFNKRMRKIGLPEINFERVDIELQGGQFIVGLVPDPQMRIRRDVAAQVGRARSLLNSGVLANAVRVNAPSAASWNTQLETARAIWDAAHPEPTEEEKAAALEAEQAAQAQEPTGALKHTAGPMPDKRSDPEAYVRWEEADRLAKSYEQTAVAPTDSDDLPPIGNPIEPPEPEQFDFDVDYSLWDVYFADGSCRPFDATTQAFMDES